MKTINTMKKEGLVEYVNSCYWFTVALSTSLEGIQFRSQNPQIDFAKCRNNCPLYNSEECCNQYKELSNSGLSISMR